MPNTNAALIANRVKRNPAASFAKIEGTTQLPAGRGNTILDQLQRMDGPVPVMDMGGDVIAAAKSLPLDDSTLAGLKAKAANVRDYEASQQSPIVPAKDTSTKPSDLISPRAKYGSRPGEVRLDKDGNVIPAKIMDNGGDIDDSEMQMPSSTAAANSAAAAGAVKAMTPDKQAPDTSKGLLNHFIGKQIPTDDRAVAGVPQISSGTSNAAPAMPTMGGVSSAPVPVFDKGVDVRDGQHVPAILQTGERVLSRKDNEMYKQGYRPIHIYDECQDVSALIPPTDQPTFVSEPKEKGTQPEAQPMRSDVSQDQLIPAEQPKGTPEERKAISVDRQKAMGKGQAGLVDLGLSNIHENHLQPQPPEGNLVMRDAGLPKIDTGGQMPLSGRESGYTPIAMPPNPGDVAQTKAGGALIPQAAAEETQGQRNDLAGMKYKAQLANMDAKIKDALANGDTDTADKLQYAKGRLQQATPWGSAGNHDSMFGKIAHGLARTGEIASDILSPGLLQAVPNTPEWRAQQNKGQFARISQDVENTKNLAEADAANAKVTKSPWEPQAGAEFTHYDANGVPDQQLMRNTETGAKEWQAVPRIGGAAPAEQPTIGTQPNIAAKATALTAGTYGPPKEPKELKEGEQPATDAQMADVGTRIQNNPSLTAQQRTDLQFPPNYKPTANDVKERLANVKDIEDAARQGKQDELNNGIRTLMAQNSNLMAQAHLSDLQEKMKQADAKSTENSNVAMGGLYAQENYKDAVDAWHNSRNFAKDSGLVTEIINKEHGDKGAFSGALGTTLVGSMFGPEGAALGAGVGAVTSALKGPADGYLETLKKNGISDEGYAAMQAYFNALPARMSYEIGVQGVAASALRSAQLIQKVLQTVPMPNTPQGSFDSAFDQYYKPMETLTKSKIKLTSPKDYVAPSKSDFYEQKATHTGISSVDGKLYDLDANGKKIGLHK